MDLDENESANKRKRDPADEGDQDLDRGQVAHDVEHPELMEIMCEDAAWSEECQPDAEHQSLDGNQSIYDDLTGKPLVWAKVLEARLDEIKGLMEQGVWKPTPIRECLRKTGTKPIRERWVVFTGATM